MSGGPASKTIFSAICLNCTSLWSTVSLVLAPYSTRPTTEISFTSSHWSDEYYSHLAQAIFCYMHFLRKHRLYTLASATSACFLPPYFWVCSRQTHPGQDWDDLLPFLHRKCPPTDCSTKSAKYQISFIRGPTPPRSGIAASVIEWLTALRDCCFTL